jgi:hypothetical protein
MGRAYEEISNFPEADLLTENEEYTLPLRSGRAAFRSALGAFGGGSSNLDLRYAPGRPNFRLLWVAGVRTKTLSVS